ncbi:MAG: YggS family pyridoxal phosphate-dependent enzyme [Polyangiaceae bacterium]|nr:YggS family pyridoxal phosphate-dependent enzyme [Polyangiaceae bacterium]
MISPEEIASNLQQQRQRIKDAATRAGRDPTDIRLIAVSKYQPADAIEAAYQAGHRDFGENYAQEIVQKSLELSHLKDLRFHMIGHLQTNKVKKIISKFNAIHTVSSLKLVEELNRRSAISQSDKAQAPLAVMIEVNLSGEPQKKGCQAKDAATLVAAIQASPALQLSGLMTMPAAHPDPEASRPIFEELTRLRDQLGGRQSLPRLSMGMSRDAEVAIACGSTDLRIGTAIFGSRPPREKS